MAFLTALLAALRAGLFLQLELYSFLRCDSDAVSIVCFRLSNAMVVYIFADKFNRSNSWNNYQLHALYIYFILVKCSAEIIILLSCFEKTTPPHCTRWHYFMIKSMCGYA